MAEIYLEPNGFQGQIDSFKAEVDSVKAIKYEIDKHGVRLESVDRYMECVDYLNDTLLLFTEILDMDIKSMIHIKAEWMHVDDEIAAKTVGDIVKSGIDNAIKSIKGDK